jgi:uncharacterized membrane protein YjdF
MVAIEYASPAHPKRGPALRLVGIVASLAFIAMSVFVAKPGSNYRFSALFLVPIVWAPYLLRRRIHLHPLHYLLFALALLLHNLGALGFYQRAPLGLSFDIYVHFYFGVVGGLMLYRYLGKTVALTSWQRRIATVLLIIGMGAIHELVEWFSTLILGPKHGMLKTEGVYEFDTQRDMFDNLLGAIVAVALYAVAHRRARRAAADGVRSGKPEAPPENGDSRAAAPPLETRLKEGSET